PIAQPPPKPSGVAKISGRIVDENGDPRSDAQADLDLGSLCIWIYTDSDGRFEATLAPGDYEAHAADDADSGPAVSVSLHAGDEVHDLVLELPQGRPTMHEEFS